MTDSMTTQEKALRAHLAALLKGGQAHATFTHAVADFPIERAGEKPQNAPYSAWELLEHIRISLHDLLDFSTDSDYVDKDWPADYWPKSASPSGSEEWQESVRAVESDLKDFEALIQNPSSNLYATVPWGKNRETLLREVLIAADHTSYHVGELILLRKLMGAWTK